MIPIDLDAPPAPQRTSSSLPTGSRVTFEGAQSWRESIAALLALLLCVSIFISAVCIGLYVYRDNALYDELVDYLDKTISISKINYNPMLGLYKLNEKELEALGDHRTYKTILWFYLGGEMGCYFLLAAALIIYFTTDISQGTMRVIFCILISLACLYCIFEVHIFSFMLFPYSGTLPNSTEQLLNHAIPHNPGGLLQMEQRLGCTFDHNLYAANKRRMNPKNTCDPDISSAFIPLAVLIFLMVVRLLPILICILLMVKRTPISESLAQLVEKIKPGSKKQRMYAKKPAGGNVSNLAEKKSTMFGVTNNRGTSTPLPPLPPNTSLDHSISYNNAAYIGDRGLAGLNSSRSSEISRIDHHDIFKAPLTHYASGSLQSEV